MSTTKVLGKEETLEKFCDKRCFLSIDGHPDMRVIDGDANPVLEAMSEFANQEKRIEAIAFERWKMTNGWLPEEGSNTYRSYYHNEELTLEQLYDFYNK